MDANSSHTISLAEASELTANFRALLVPNPALLLSGIKGEAFGKFDINLMLSQEGCTGTRIYYGLRLLPLPKIVLILVGVDALGNDLYTGLILENGSLCPPNCSVNNPLNS